jgi:hypothetical protein
MALFGVVFGVAALLLYGALYAVVFFSSNI